MRGTNTGSHFKKPTLVTPCLVRPNGEPPLLPLLPLFGQILKDFHLGRPTNQPYHHPSRRRRRRPLYRIPTSVIFLALGQDIVVARVDGSAGREEGQYINDVFTTFSIFVPPSSLTVVFGILYFWGPSHCGCHLSIILRRRRGE